VKSALPVCEHDGERSTSQAGRRQRSLLEQLTPRQREVLLLVVEGCKTKVIAKTLAISTKTVELHRSQMMKALGIRHVPGLVRYAIREGLISADN